MGRTGENDSHQPPPNRIVVLKPPLGRSAPEMSCADWSRGEGNCAH